MNSFSLKSKRINRKTFWFLSITSILLMFLLGTAALLELPSHLAYGALIVLVAVFLIIRVILITLRANDISSDFQNDTWKHGIGLILGNWSLWFMPSKSSNETSENFAEKILQQPKKVRLFLIGKNIFFFVIFIIVISIILFIINRGA